VKTLIIGANGQLGRAFRKRLDTRKIPFLAADRSVCDITKAGDVPKLLDSYKPDVVINCTAYNSVDAAEDDRATAFAVNAEAVKEIARCCDERRAIFVHYSTDYVFDGSKGSPYVESDVTGPLSVYAQSKLAGEQSAMTEAKEHLVFRVSWVLGEGKQNFLYKLRQWTVKNDVIRVAADEISVPTFAGTIVDVTLDALKAGLRGLFHLTSSGSASRFEYASFYLDAAGIKGKTLVPVSRTVFGLKAKRPGYSVMSNDLLQRTMGIRVPDWKDAVREFMREVRIV